MVEKMALKIVGKMEKRKIINESNCKYYTYALIAIAENTVTVCTMLLIGLLFNQFLYTICFIYFFLSLRRRTGGFHADKFWQCYFGTVIIHILIIQIASAVCRNQTIMYGLLFGAAISIWIWEQ